MNKKENKENKIILVGIGMIFIVLFITIGRYSFDKKNSSKEIINTEKSSYTDYNYITPSELSNKIINKEAIKLIDIRDSVSFEKSHIENSINISYQNFDSIFKNIGKDELLIIIGYDAENEKDVSAVIKKLKTELKFKNVLALKDGIFGWAAESNPLISEGNKESALDWSKVDYINPEQLKLALESKYLVFVLDTRDNVQYKSGHIPTAVNIPLDELELRKSEIPISKEILVYGSDTDNDFKSAVKLNDLGFLATYTIRGGFTAWQEKRFEMER